VIDRYSRQTLFHGIKEEGQKKLAGSSIAIIGCGALGTVTATTLARAGVGRIRIVDRDFIEYHNLQRQVIFTEDDIKEQLPKAVAAARYLKKVNSGIDIEGIVADVNYSNIERLVSGFDVIVDGLDNLETRFLINDISQKLHIPWVYGGAISAYGMLMTVVPGKTPCFRCVSDHPSGPSVGLTCDTAGVIAPAPLVVGSLQSVEVIKLLTGNNDFQRGITYVDVWNYSLHNLKVNFRPDCPACHGRYEFLERKFGSRTTSLCGQNAVQITNSDPKPLSLPDLAQRLGKVGSVKYNEFMLNFSFDHQEMVVFPDGRAIIKNTSDESVARGLYAKYLGA